MTAVNRTTLYSYFDTGDRPTSPQFDDLIDSSLNLVSTSAQTIVSDISALGNLSVSSTLNVISSAVFGGDVTIDGNLAIAGSFSQNNLAIVSALSVGGQSTFNTVVISGPTSAQNISATGTLTVNGATVLASAKGVTPAAGTSSTDFATTAFVNPGSTLTANGSRTNPDGSIDKWGTTGSIAPGETVVTLPVAFPNALFVVTPTSETADATATSNNYWVPVDKTSFKIGNKQSGNAVFSWRAIGN